MDREHLPLAGNLGLGAFCLRDGFQVSRLDRRRFEWYRYCYWGVMRQNPGIACPNHAGGFALVLSLRVIAYE